MEMIMTLRQAADLARSSEHGSFDSQTAISTLINLYIDAIGHDPMCDRPNTPGASYLDPLWAWVNSQLN